MYEDSISLYYNEKNQLVLGIDAGVGLHANTEVNARYVFKPYSSLFDYLNQHLRDESTNNAYIYFALLVGFCLNGTNKNTLGDLLIPDLILTVADDVTDPIYSNDEVTEIKKKLAELQEPEKFIDAYGKIKPPESNFAFLWDELGIDHNRIDIMASFGQESSPDRYTVDYANNTNDGLMYYELFEDQGDDEKYNCHYHIYLYEKNTHRLLGQREFNNIILKEEVTPPHNVYHYEGNVFIPSQCLQGNDGQYVAAGNYYIYFSASRTYVLTPKPGPETIYCTQVFNGANSVLRFLVENGNMEVCNDGLGLISSAPSGKWYNTFAFKYEAALYKYQGQTIVKVKDLYTDTPKDPHKLRMSFTETYHWGTNLTAAGSIPILPAIPAQSYSYLPLVDFTYTQNPNNPLEVTFQAANEGTPAVSWAWDFGDDTTANTQNPTHTFPLSGTYAVTVTGYNAAGEADSKTHQLTLRYPPKIEIIADPDQGLYPLWVNFSGASTGGHITNWSWDFADNSTGIGPSIDYVYNTPGYYKVTLNVEGPGGTDKAIAHILVLEECPDFDFIAIPQKGTLPLTVEFKVADCGGPADTWVWDFGDETVTQHLIDPNMSHTYTKRGTCSVSLCAYGLGGATYKIKDNYITVRSDISPIVNLLLDD